MLPLSTRVVSQALFLICGFILIKEIRSEARVVCYYTNWSVYRPGTAKFNPQNINPYLCTHLIYAFGGFTKDNTLKPFDKYQDIEQGGYAKFTGLKTYNKNLKTLLAIGGWNEGSSRFSPLMANLERRQQFIKNILKFLRQNHFDGLDLDWEYPTFRDGGKPRDKENYAQFVEELRLEFNRESAKTGRPKLLLTMAVPAGIEYIEKGYNIPKLNKNLDWFNILTYDYHSAYEPSVNHHSPLRTLEEDNEYNFDNELNIDYTIKYYLNAGADRNKLVLGIPTYGRSYTLINEEITDIGAPADGPGEQGDATREKGYLAYYEICQAIRADPDWTIVQLNPNVMGPYAFRKNQWVSYDDENIVRKKAEYVAENGLGGIMFWSIDNDDFRGTCTGKPYPLIEAGKAALLDHLGFGENKVERPNHSKKPTQFRNRQISSNQNRISDETYIDKTTSSPRKRVSNRKRVSTTTNKPHSSSSSSLHLATRATTPEPPTTPDPGSDFKCEEEGFFAHPRDCKKYFWCLDSGPSNLGIVAHQFTCPSGLYFNTAADSCDFSRNVLCNKKTETAAKTTKITSTSTTTNSPKVTAATSRNTFLKFTTTSSTTPTSIYDEEYYDDEENSYSSSTGAEEDPKVIKELIELIKKVGGLEELEKQLQIQEDGSMIIKNDHTKEVSTTQPSISKSLYSKVLSRPNSLSSLRNRLETGQSKNNTLKLVDDKESNEENKYSSVIRNSRPSPQNAGIDKLPEFESFLKEKPKYVTITRAKPTQSTSPEDDIEVDLENIKSSTQIPLYANIRRPKPINKLNDEKEENNFEATTRVTYQTISRRKGASDSTNNESFQTTQTNRYKSIERSRPQPEDLKTVVKDDKNKEIRTSPITVQFLDVNQYTKPHLTQKLDSTTTITRTYANVARGTTTPTLATATTYLEETTSTPDVITTTPQHSKNTTTITSTILSSKFNTSLSPTILITPSVEIDSKSTEHIFLNNEIHSDSTLRTQTIHNQTPFSVDLGTDFGLHDTTPQTVKKTNSSSYQTFFDDEVTLTDINQNKNLNNTNIGAILTTTVASAINRITNNDVKDYFSSNIHAQTDKVLSKTDVGSNNHQLNQDFVKSTEFKQASRPSIFDTTTEKLNPLLTTRGTIIRPTRLKNSDNFQISVSSPRPFGFPRRRTRPPIIHNSTPLTNSYNNADISTDITSSSKFKKKTRQPLVTNRPNSRRPILSVRRRLTTTTTNPLSSPLNDFYVSTTQTTLTSDIPSPSYQQDIVTTSNFNKYTRRNRPTIFSSSTSVSGATTIKSIISENTKATNLPSQRIKVQKNNDSTISLKSHQKHIVRRKFGINGGNNVRRNSSSTIPPTNENVYSLQTTPRTSNPLFRRRHTFTTSTPRKDLPITTFSPSFSKTLPDSSTHNLSLITDDIDQEAGSSIIQDQKFTNNRYNKIGENLEDELLVDAIKAISRAPIPKISSTTIQYLQQITPQEDIENLTPIQPIKRRIGINNIEKSSISKNTVLNRTIKTTSTTTASPHTNQLSPHRKLMNNNKPFEKIKSREFSGRTYRPVIDYDYYDDEDSKLVGKSNSQVKVILHGPGIIECLDQGNFPHPLSCRKFISCAKMETGGVVGWEYTCPKGLSYDPVGGICNWAAGLGCKE